MDLIKAANDALAARKAVSEKRNALIEDTTATDAEKRTQYEKMDAEIKALGDEARKYFNEHKDDEELRNLNAQAAILTGAREDKGQEKRTQDEAAELRALGRGQRADVDFDMGQANFRVAQTSVAANAGNTKPTATFVNEVFQAMRERSEFFSYVRTLNTASGETLEIPVKNAIDPTLPPVSGTVGIVAENTTMPKVDQAWTKVNLGAYKYGIIFEATLEILEDTQLNLLAILGNDAGETLADKIMQHLILGTGTSQPFGWATRAATSGVNAATSGAITFDNMLDLQYSLRAPYRKNGVYMINDAINPIVRKLKDSTGQYLWQPSVQAGMPDTIWGKPVLTDLNLATSGASAKVALFGDPSKYIMRQVRSLKVTRSDEYGFDRDVVAFKLTWRGDGNVFDLNSVKALTVTA